MRPETHTAVILAAGRGSRLTDHTAGRPKCLLDVGGRTLIERQVHTLQDLGVRRIVVVVGYRQEMVRDCLGDTCEFVHNPHYASTNSLYSMWTAREHVDGPMVLMNCDVVAHPEILARVLHAPTSALAYDPASGDEAEQMKVTIEEGYVRAMGKDLPPEQTHGENVGTLKFSLEGARALFEEATRAVASGDVHAWAPKAVGAISQRVPIQAVGTDGLPWCEIDFPEDLAHARVSIAPYIDAVRPRFVLSEMRSPLVAPNVI